MNAEISTPRSGNRSLILIGAGVVALTIVTVIVVLLVGAREATDFAADSPEGTLQGYLTAYEAGDLDASYAYFSADVRRRMNPEDYRRAVDAHGGAHGTEPARRILFERTTGQGDRVQVHLSVEEFSTDGLNGNAYRSPRNVRLVREAGQWRIDDALVWLDPALIEPKL